MKNDELAFPRPYSTGHLAQEGMTLRDYFAAQAMSAYFDGNDSPSEFGMVARRSYQMADAMLIARELE